MLMGRGATRYFYRHQSNLASIKRLWYSGRVCAQCVSVISDYPQVTAVFRLTDQHEHVVPVLTWVFPAEFKISSILNSLLVFSVIWDTTSGGRRIQILYLGKSTKTTV